MLVIDCCIRGDESATRQYYRSYLGTLPADTEIEILELSGLGLDYLDLHTLEKRSILIEKGDFSDEMFDLARQFRDADEILIAAPFWDLSFPALLKVYFEQICVTGLTFAYTDTGAEGLCKARQLLFFSTCGGFTGGHHLGYEYVVSLAAMLGITNCAPYIIEGLDIDPLRRSELVADAIAKLHTTKLI